ncbi:hypothetical protein F5Y08DRAFT_318642 [Xylaria arbuscula]|nr:hypothetical protein F5Y08DRAFT_318642 [Xylaria arbuscula]
MVELCPLRQPIFSYLFAVPVCCCVPCAESFGLVVAILYHVSDRAMPWRRHDIWEELFLSHSHSKSTLKLSIIPEVLPPVKP